jgi:hypothetical protein
MVLGLSKIQAILCYKMQVLIISLGYEKIVNALNQLNKLKQLLTLLFNGKNVITAVLKPEVKNEEE